MRRALVALLASAMLGGGALAQYPDKPIRLVVPQAAGSATDTVSRLLAPEMGKSLGADEYMTKPFSPSKIIEKANEVLKSRG